MPLKCRSIFSNRIIIDATSGIIGGQKPNEGWFGWVFTVSMQAAAAGNLGPTAFFRPILVPNGYVAFIQSSNLATSGVGGSTGYGFQSMTQAGLPEQDMFQQAAAPNIFFGPLPPVPLGIPLENFSDQGAGFQNFYSAFGGIQNLFVPGNYQMNAQMAAPEGQLTACEGLWTGSGILVQDIFAVEAQTI